jgi:hypothetical protein
MARWKWTGSNLTPKLIDVVDDMRADVFGSVDVNCLAGIVGKLVDPLDQPIHERCCQAGVNVSKERNEIAD